MAARGRSRVKQRGLRFTDGQRQKGRWVEGVMRGQKVRLGWGQEAQLFLWVVGSLPSHLLILPRLTASPVPEAPLLLAPAKSHHSHNLVPLLSPWQQLDPWRARSGRKAVSRPLMVRVGTQA